VLQPSRIYEGKKLFELPNLIIEWAEDAPITQLAHPDFGRLEKEKPDLYKTQHTPEGFLIATGKNINNGAEVTEPDILDLAPTFLYLLEETVPNYMEGRVLRELLTEDFRKNR